jgi:hypothetical protein
VSYRVYRRSFSPCHDVVVARDGGRQDSGKHDSSTFIGQRLQLFDNDSAHFNFTWISIAEFYRGWPCRRTRDSPPTNRLTTSACLTIRACLDSSLRLHRRVENLRGSYMPLRYRRSHPATRVLALPTCVCTQDDLYGRRTLVPLTLH